jgi:uncharacterized protein (TIGR02001 family)
MKLFSSRPLLILALAGGSAWADFKASVSFMSDEVYRGYSKSRNNPAVTGNLEYSRDPGFYTGLWVSSVSFDDTEYPDRASVEINPYLGWSFRIAADWRTDISASGYVYDGKIYGMNSNYAELAGALHFRDVLSARIAYAPDAYGRDAGTIAYELTARYFPADNWQISAGLGFYQASELVQRDSFYWNAGLTWYPIRYLALDLRYVGTTAGEYREGGTHSYYEFRPRPLDFPLLFTLTAGF